VTRASISIPTPAITHAMIAPRPRSQSRSEPSAEQVIVAGMPKLRDREVGGHCADRDERAQFAAAITQLAAKLFTEGHAVTVGEGEDRNQATAWPGARVR
jgi:hypothetical protein